MGYNVGIVGMVRRIFSQKQNVYVLVFILYVNGCAQVCIC